MRAVLIYTHPYASRSVANRTLLAAVRDLPEVAVRSLCDLYPEFSIDVAAEQRALAEAELVIWQHPLYWYGPPALHKLWIDEVLRHGWAYGPGGNALAGKACLWVTTTGGSAESYTPAGEHALPFEHYVAPMRQTARYCGMRWIEPLIVHRPEFDGAPVLAEAAQIYRRRIEDCLQAPREPVHG